MVNSKIITYVSIVLVMLIWGSWHSNEKLVGHFVYGGCYLLYNDALKKLPAAKVGNFLNLDPIIGAVIVVVFLNEPIPLWMLLAGGTRVNRLIDNE